MCDGTQYDRGTAIERKITNKTAILAEMSLLPFSHFILFFVHFIINRANAIPFTVTASTDWCSLKREQQFESAAAAAAAAAT
jgi:hypothetical protein